VLVGTAVKVTTRTGAPGPARRVTREEGGGVWIKRLIKNLKYVDGQWFWWFASLAHRYETAKIMKHQPQQLNTSPTA
jgi:hypothetical protein